METEKHCLRVVVKVGTSTLTHDTGRLNLHNMELLARTLSDLEGMGHEVILVSSGAIAVGTAKMGLKARPTELRMKQAAAAVGQCMMMHLYDKMFGEYNRVVAQILLTGEDVDAPVRAEQRKRLGVLCGDRDRQVQGSGRQRHLVGHGSPAVPGGPAGASERH